MKNFIKNNLTWILALISFVLSGLIVESMDIKEWYIQISYIVILSLFLTCCMLFIIFYIKSTAKK